MPKSSPLTYTCAKCGGSFESFNDDAAQEEALLNWGQRGDMPGMAIVCDDCYQAFMAWWRDEKDEDHQ